MAQVWYYRRGDHSVGPWSSAEFRSLASIGMIQPDDQIRTADKSKWSRAADVRGLKFGTPPNAVMPNDLMELSADVAGTAPTTIKRVELPPVTDQASQPPPAPRGPNEPVRGLLAKVKAKVEAARSDPATELWYAIFLGCSVGAAISLVTAGWISLMLVGGIVGFISVLIEQGQFTNLKVALPPTPQRIKRHVGIIVGTLLFGYFIGFAGGRSAAYKRGYAEGQRDRAQTASVAYSLGDNSLLDESNFAALDPEQVAAETGAWLPFSSAWDRNEWIKGYRAGVRGR